MLGMRILVAAKISSDIGCLFTFIEWFCAIRFYHRQLKPIGEGSISQLTRHLYQCTLFHPISTYFLWQSSQYFHFVDITWSQTFSNSITDLRPTESFLFHFQFRSVQFSNSIRVLRGLITEELWRLRWCDT